MNSNRVGQAVAEKAAVSVFNPARVRGDFPILSREVNGSALVYLDNAATSQKPQSVIDAISRYYRSSNSNIHRGVHSLSQEATEAYEQARSKVQKFIGASNSREVIFVRGTTEGINLVAQTYGRQHLGAGDEVLITTMEHHSNIVPWQLLCKQTGASLRVAPINKEGELKLDRFQQLLSPRTRLVALVHVSNALGTVNPVQEIIEISHDHGIPVLLDSAQAVPHLQVDVQQLDCDFLTFSAHKMFGPTGIGVLYGKAGLLEEMDPYQGGGDMIQSVSFEKTTFNVLPHKFEAGTPNIAGVVGLGAAIDYLENLGMENVYRHETELLEYGTEVIGEIPGLRLIGTASTKASVLSFTIEGIHPHDVGTVLDQEGIAVRTGHHCAQPVMDFFSIPATTRASLALYNTREDIDRLSCGIRAAIKVLG